MRKCKVVTSFRERSGYCSGNVPAAVYLKKLDHLWQSRDAAATAEETALHGGHGVGECQCPLQCPAPQFPESAGAVKHVPGATGIHRLDPESRDPDPPAFLQADGPFPGEGGGDPGQAPIRHLAEAVIERRVPRGRTEEPGVAHQGIRWGFRI